MTGQMKRGTNSLLLELMHKNPVSRDVWDSQMSIHTIKRCNTAEMEKEVILPINSLMPHILKTLGIPSDEYSNTSRKGMFIKARKIAYIILHRQYGFGCVTIGRMFDKNHSTILNAFKEMDIDTLKFDKSMLVYWELVKKSLNIKWTFVYAGGK
jgi:chromosomal replication initiation ATPase DnaA